MLNHTNIDRSNSMEISPAPFTYTSTRLLGTVQLPADAFISVRVYAEDNYRIPYRIHSVEPGGRINFCDSTGQIRLYWQTYADTEALTAASGPYVSSLLFNMNRVIAGHICCTRQALDLIRGVINSLSQTLLLPADAFVLIPQCHIPMMGGFCRAIAVNGVYSTSDIHIQGSTESVITNYNDALSVSLINTQAQLNDNATGNTLCYIVVNGSTVDCKGKSIIMKSSMLSNLRVGQEDGKVTLKGVTDA
jgi:hypothetical protein